MQDLNISYIQASLHWEGTDANLSLYDSFLQKLPNKQDLLVLPEMFNTGFTMDAQQFCEKMEGKTMVWMEHTAKKHQITVCGSLIINEGGNYFNRFIWMPENGNYKYYDKRHLFRLAKEERVYTEGKEHLFVQIRDWNIQPFVCYDLRFPVWCRNTKDVDLQLYVANWPEKRSMAWKTLLRARAIENLCYVLGVNRVGMDGNNIHHSGDSALVHPSGECLQELSNTEGLICVSLQKDELTGFRRKFQFYKDRDSFRLEP